jgi:hypothetical protein
MSMKSTMASRILSALVFTQLLLCAAGVASVLVRHNADAPQMATDVATSSAVRI